MPVRRKHRSGPDAVGPDVLYFSGSLGSRLLAQTFECETPRPVNRSSPRLPTPGPADFPHGAGSAALAAHDIGRQTPPGTGRTSFCTPMTGFGPARRVLRHDHPRRWAFPDRSPGRGALMVRVSSRLFPRWRSASAAGWASSRTAPAPCPLRAAGGPFYLLVTPWNFPLAMRPARFAPALAAGCRSSSAGRLTTLKPRLLLVPM